VNQVEWDSIYHKGNPPALQRIAERPLEEAASLFARFEVLLKMIIAFHRIGPIEIDPHPNVETKDLVFSEDDVEECYRNSVTWPRRYFQYSPRFVHDHFQEFFEIARS
jgi:hypothetical protein